nr:reverse transcriptase domain-containing protein [Tanacetum cinerariifolium]
MSAMANTTLLVTTVTKSATNPKDADATSRVNIYEFCEEYYEDILPIIMDKVHRDRRKDVHTRLDFEEGPRERTREDSRHSSHRRQSAFDRLSKTYSPSTTKSRTHGIDSRDHPRGRSCPHRLDTSNEDYPKDRERLCGVGESYDDSFSHRSRHMKRRRDSESPLSSVSKSDSSDGRFTPLTRMPKEILTAEAGKFQSPPPMVTPVEKRSSNKFCDFHNDQGIAWMSSREEILTIRSTILIPTECTSVITSSAISKEERTRPDNFNVSLHPDFSDQEVAIEGTLLEKGRTELCSILKKNLDIFAWQPSDMTGSPERAKAIQAEVQKIVEVGIMREVYYDDWLSKPVMVKKHDGSWRMCVDFTDLNKACPQDCYPLLEIDWKVESLCGYPWTLTKATTRYSWQNRTKRKQLSTLDKGQIDQNIEVYVEDLVVKSYTEAEMLRDIDETFRTLQKINMKLNPKKCTFGVAEGVFLGYVVTPDGIKPCPDKTSAVLQLPSSRTIKEVKSLNGKLASLNRFLPKSAEKTAAKIECHARRTQYHVPAKNVGQRTDPGGISYRNARRKLTSHASGRNSTRAVDTLHGWLIMSSNNEAEYEALIAGLRIAAQMGVQNVHVLVEILKDKSIKEKEVTTVVEEDRLTWMTPIVEYLKEGTLLNDMKEARKLCIKARQYELLEGILYRRSFLTSWLRCVGLLQAEYVIREIHEGSCSMHAGPRSAEGPGKVKFLIVAMDYFTKWIEVKAVATITGGQYSDNPFKDWCDKLNITQRFASIKHAQSNGLVERANQSLEEGIKACLGEGNKNWVEELPHVLWTHRTMIKSSHDDNHFSLTYGTEAVIPAKIRMPTYRTAAVDVVYNDEELWLNLDLLEERRERAAICEAKAKLKMTKYYNARVRGVTFRPGDFVYRSNDASHAVKGGKLGPKWEGPYEVTEALGDGAYKLRSMDGTILPKTWNIANLKRCYLFVTAHAWISATIRTCK